MTIFAESPKRDKQIKFYVSEEERESIQRLADSLGIGVSDLLRRAINELAKQQQEKRKKR